MNIFITDKCPKIAAQQLCDQHIRGKMILESVQMLSSCVRVFLDSHDKQLEMDEIGIYKAGRSHVNHECNLWVRESLSNFLWLTHHAIEMDDIRVRYGYKPHKSMDTLRNVLLPYFICNSSKLKSCFTHSDITVPFLAMTEDLKHQHGTLYLKAQKYGNNDKYRASSWEDCSKAYQKFINSKVFKDGNTPSWTVNLKPEWAK